MLNAQEALLKRHATKSSSDWYAEGKRSPLKSSHAHNTHKTTLGILLLETKIDHMLPGLPGWFDQTNPDYALRSCLFLYAPSPSEHCCFLQHASVGISNECGIACVTQVALRFWLDCKRGT